MEAWHDETKTAEPPPIDWDAARALDQRREAALARGLTRVFDRGGHATEDWSFSKPRRPLEGKDALRDSADLGRLLANRLWGFNVGRGLFIVKGGSR